MFPAVASWSLCRADLHDREEFETAGSSAPGSIYRCASDFLVVSRHLNVGVAVHDESALIERSRFRGRIDHA